MNILGINGINDLFHDASATLIMDNQIIASVEEERFNRKKHSNGIPFHAVEFCLNRGGITLADIDHIGYYLDPAVLRKVFVDDVVAKYGASPASLAYYSKAAEDISRVRDVLFSHFRFGRKTQFHYINHHLAHAGSAYYISGFHDSSVLTIDGSGDRETCTLYHGSGPNLKKAHDFLLYPESLGFLYTVFASHLGLGWISGPGKLMGLAGYGKVSPGLLDDIIVLAEDPYKPVSIDLSFFNYHIGGSGFSQKGLERFGKPRQPHEPLEQIHCDLAATMQNALEDAILHLVKMIPHHLPKVENLCFAGGVALNVCTNRRIHDLGLFEGFFVSPPAYDGGTSLGCALVLDAKTTGCGAHEFNVYSGPDISRDFDIEAAIETYVDRVRWSRMSEDQLCHTAAKMISENKIIGWVQGRMECGPRALGNRSILTNPVNRHAKDDLNTRVKKREYFRPYAPSVLAEECLNWFDIASSPYMLMEAKVHSHKREKVPGIVHVDGTARPQSVTEQQNPRYYKLICKVHELTGVPMVLNTSFNMHGEPIVNTPEDAIEDLLGSGLDALFVGDYCIVRAEVTENTEAEDQTHPADVIAGLRDKWRELPGTRQERLFSRNMLEWSDQQLLQYWEEGRRQTSTPEVRGWFQQLYKDEFAGKEVADIGPGIGVDGIFFAQHGARVTFVDIVQDNLTLLQRICALKGIRAEYYFVEDFFAFHFDKAFDVFMAIGSFLNAPFDFMKKEVAALSPFLRIGGKVVMLAYPKERYIQLGAQSFEHFGKMTDGERTPWAEWYDDEKTKSLFGPDYRLNWSRNFGTDGIEFNWFDLTKVSCAPQETPPPERNPVSVLASDDRGNNATLGECKGQQVLSPCPSIVTVTCNDGRGGDVRRRTPSFSKGLCAQAARSCSAIDVSERTSLPIRASCAGRRACQKVSAESLPIAAHVQETPYWPELSQKQQSKRSPMNVGQMVSAGIDMYHKGDVPNATSVFRHAVAADPEHANAWNNLGVLLVQQNQISEGLRCFQNAFRRDRTNGALVSNYVSVLRKAGRSDEAHDVVDQYLRAGGDPQRVSGVTDRRTEAPADAMPLDDGTIPFVPVQELHRALGFQTPIDYPASSLTKSLGAWKMEIDDMPIFRYLYRHFRPRRHLEFGTWQGAGVVYCLQECDATVWTLNLPFGESQPNGEPAYSGDGDSYGLGTSLVGEWARRIGLPEQREYPTDSFGFIGRFYLEKQLGHRVCQIFCDSRQWDTSNYPPGFFDTALIDGGHFPEIVASDSRKALSLLRPGGLVLWHDFCPPMRDRSPVVQGVMQGVESIRDLLADQLERWFWIKPSHILVGRKKT